MSGRIFSISMAAMLVLSAQAGAQEIREVDVFYDRYGREVLVDIYTGEVVAIREPQGSVIRRGFEERPRDRVYLDDQADDARLRRERRREELGRGIDRQRLPEYRDYRAYPEPDYDDDYGYDDDFAREDPRYSDPYRSDPTYDDGRGFRQPGPVEQQRVERAPLDAPTASVAPEAEGQPEVIIEQQPTAVPDISQPPQIGVNGATEDVAKIQVLLDRLGAAPGVIDGRMGDNVNKAISAYRDLTGETLRTYDKEYIDAMLAETGGEAFTTYEITAVDVAGPFVASIPSDYGEKAQLERMSYTSVAEMLAERFHMDERYLRSLNPGVGFDRPGTIIRVTKVVRNRDAKVMRVVADKGRKQVRAYDGAGKLVAVYPSTIGSSATPSPTGTHTVERVALDPEYTYNPKVNFQQGNNTRVLTIPPGPNGPVGSVWIGLSKPTYGIHGTPEPSKIGKTESNGCIRLTNWDARELAGMVEVGATVEFVD